MKGRINSVESMGSLDGPGIRTVFFMQGCNMKCLYCHNRDSWEMSAGESISIGEIVSTALSFRDYYGSRGGVTFSGGEPLLQSRFLIAVFRELKKKGIHITLDTSGSVFNCHTAELINLSDLVILDIKHADPDLFKDMCGYSGSNSYETLKFLKQSAVPYWIRQVILTGYTDSDEQIDKLKTLISGEKSPHKIELLPYHSGGKEKWTALGLSYPLPGCREPSVERMSQLKTRLLSSSTVFRK